MFIKLSEYISLQIRRDLDRFDPERLLFQESCRETGGKNIGQGGAR